MNKKFLLFFGIIGIGAIGLGFLSNNIGLTVQSFGLFDSVETFTGGFSCACSCSDGTFSSGCCNTQYLDPPPPPTIPHPDSLGLVGNMLCLWETHQEDYGWDLDNQEYFESGVVWSNCGPSDAISWPPGLEPDFSFNEIFQTTLASNNGAASHSSTGGCDSSSVVKICHIPPGNPNNAQSISITKKYLQTHLDHGDELGECSGGSNSNSGGLNPNTGGSGGSSSNSDNVSHQQDSGSFSLGDALNVKSSSYDEMTLAKESTAALLNAAHTEIFYPLSVSEIIAKTQRAIVNEDYTDTIKEFRKYNKLAEKPDWSEQKFERERGSVIYDTEEKFNSLPNEDRIFKKVPAPTKMIDEKILSPLAQIKLGVEPDLVQCKEGLTLIFKENDMMPACVKESSVQKLIEIGWAADSDSNYQE